MSTEIYLKTGELSSRTLRKAINETEAAYKKTEKAVDEALMYLSYTVCGDMCYLFPSDATNNLLSAEYKLKKALEKLNSLKPLLDSGPKDIEEIDCRYKSDLKEWRKSGNHDNILWAVSGGASTATETKIDNDNSSKEEKYRDEVNRISTAEPVGQPQDPDSWQCSWASTATILRRKQIQNGVEPTFTREGVYEYNPEMEYVKNYYDPEGNVYSTQYEDASLIQQNMGQKNISSKEEYLKSVLEEHPEGVAIFTQYPYYDDNGILQTGQHAIVITDYDIREDGSIQFYADDPVSNRDRNTGRTEIENTWMYTVNSNTSSDYFLIWYVK